MESDDGPLAIQDYALIGDCQTAALVGRNGSIDWLCWPFFDSDACFAALLGAPTNGRWSIGPMQAAAVDRRYRGETNILETMFETDEGSAALIDFMPIEPDRHAVVRRVEGRRGSLAMRMHLVLRFEYGSATPWVERLGRDGIVAVAGPNRVELRTSAALSTLDHATVADFTVAEGEAVDFVLSWNSSYLPPPPPLDAGQCLARTEAFWQDWSDRCGYHGEWRSAVLRSLLTLKALSFQPTGAIVAAPTTSLPEQLGGSRNWDYRFCWLRDATLTLVALMAGGYVEEAVAWRDWLHRAVAGHPDELQIMYGIDGKRRLKEWSPFWLAGYRGASPVRIGNAASGQVQLDTYGEVFGALRIARRHQLRDAPQAWQMQCRFVDHLRSIWDQPDDGIWEMRGERRHFTHSKVMAWVAVDSAVRDAEEFGLDAPLEDWRHLREHMHQVICDRGFDQARGSFTQSFGDSAIDASLLIIPQVGFLPADDPRFIGTVKAVEEDLLVDGFVLRYRTEGSPDGLPSGEGAFLPCSFWLATVYQQQGRHEDARALFGRLLALRNDVGLLAEEYDPAARQQVGNFPQAYSHLSLVGAALALDGLGMAEARRGN